MGLCSCKRNWFRQRLYHPPVVHMYLGSRKVSCVNETYLFLTITRVHLTAAAYPFIFIHYVLLLFSFLPDFLFHSCKVCLFLFLPRILLPLPLILILISLFLPFSSSSPLLFFPFLIFLLLDLKHLHVTCVPSVQHFLPFCLFPIPALSVLRFFLSSNQYPLSMRPYGRGCDPGASVIPARRWQ